MHTWKQHILAAMAHNGDREEEIVRCVPPLDCVEMNTPFCDSYSGERPVSAFAVWTGKHVYFPLAYDGRQWAGSAPRWWTAEAKGLAHQEDGREYKLPRNSP